MTPDPSNPADVPGSASPPPPQRPGRLWAFAIVASILAGLGSWLVGESRVRHFVPPERIVESMGVKMNIPSFEEKSRADRKNASLANGIFGGVLGLALGLAGGLARGASRAGLIAGAAGLVLGLAAGVASSEAILPYYYQQLDKGSEELSRDLILPLIIHAVSWASIGAAAGAALGIGLGDPKRIASAAVAGLVGGALAAGAYEILGALVFPNDGASEPLATQPAPRLVGRLMVAILVASLATFAILSPPRQPRKAAGPAPESA